MSIYIMSTNGSHPDTPFHQTLREAAETIQELGVKSFRKLSLPIGGNPQTTYVVDGFNLQYQVILTDGLEVETNLAHEQLLRHMRKMHKAYNHEAFLRDKLSRG